MDLYEQLVLAWLTAVKRWFVIPQPSVSKGTWRARPDFVAVDFVSHRILVIEVTKDASTGKVRDLAEKLQPAHRLTLEDAVRGSILGGALESYEMHWLFFLRDKRAVDAWDSNPDVRNYLAEHEQRHVEAIPLERVIADIQQQMP